ncbi:unnamed protein product [Vitrella brassicaformis CCMP3155]|uniref:peptidylprolyl isomerase n=2 Tax=Vitrella brassicaformis TaxID=1169539 RepID=A0A0G4EGC7_VITBC|nr:unnamed protein product [Vitrella brassicaformis CCMP3155]|eukprot:CEL94530.1 unnamed protein product [Vitrella brassicaformis CCMP3155]
MLIVIQLAVVSLGLVVCAAAFHPVTRSSALSFPRAAFSHRQPYVSSTASPLPPLPGETVLLSTVAEAPAPAPPAAEAEEADAALAAGVAREEDVSRDGGVVKRVVREGYGKLAQGGGFVKLRYTGKLAETGRVFARGDDFRCMVADGSMIKGWDLALRTMKEGEVAEVVIAPKYAYGVKGVPPVIPPNAPLLFEIELTEYEGTPYDLKLGLNIDKIETDTEKKRKDKEKAEAALTDMEKFKNWLNSLQFFGVVTAGYRRGVPWYVNPLVLYPTWFFIVGVLFYVTFSLGGLNIGGPQQEQSPDSFSIIKTIIDGFKGGPQPDT